MAPKRPDNEKNWRGKPGQACKTVEGEENPERIPALFAGKNPNGKCQVMIQNVLSIPAICDSIAFAGMNAAFLKRIDNLSNTTGFTDKAVA